MLNALNRDGRFVWNVDGCTGLVGLPSRGKRLDKCHEIDALLISQRRPRRHIGIIESAAHRTIQILVSGKCSGWRRAALKRSLREISRFRIDVRGIFASAVAAWSVTTNAVAPIKRLTLLGVAGELANLGLLRLNCGKIDETPEQQDCKKRVRKFAFHRRHPQKMKSKPRKRLLLVTSSPVTGATFLWRTIAYSL